MIEKKIEWSCVGIPMGNDGGRCVRYNRQNLLLMFDVC
jgi:hypothetical protein